MLNLENEYILVAIDKETGSVKRIFDKQKQIDYISQQANSVPFHVEYEQATITSEFSEFKYTFWKRDEATGYNFQWTITPTIQVYAKVYLEKKSKDIYFHCELVNESELPVVNLEYPIISNILPITENGEQDYFIHSFATGIKMNNPLEHFGDNSNGFRYMPYPEGFSGSTMQFFSYYGLNKGGLYFATTDSESYSKWHNFYINENKWLEASFGHACQDIGPKKGIKVPYRVTVKLLDGLDWYESADIYKRWAVKQYWCKNGPIADVSETEKSTWLMEEMGVATFGINAGHDRSKWLDNFHDYIDTKMFHILGPDWPHTVQDFGNHIPGGMADWFPTKFNAQTLNAITRHGDKYAPFEFDYLFNINGADGDKGRKALQQFPQDSLKSIDKYKFSLLCPVDPFVQHLHVERDSYLQEEMAVDAIYYDISANNILKVCMDNSHGHPIGAGKLITEAYRENYLNTKQSMKEAASGKYIPMGTEMMNEVFLDVLDYYQARAGGQPAAPLEGWNVKELFRFGKVELIPMFTYVYHEFGEVRIDGWGKLVEEIGDLFYFTVARTYLWGGLYELNYEYSPMEMVEGEENLGEEHYYKFEERKYAFSPERAKYLSQFARLRTGLGNKYLAYGKMLKPLRFTCESITLDWFHYNCNVHFKEYEDTGVIEVPSIVHSAWQYRQKSVGLFFANVHKVKQNIQLELDLNEFDLNNKDRDIRVLSIAGNELSRSKCDSNAKRKVEISIPGRDAVLIEIC